MNKRWFMIGIVLVAGAVAQADLIAPPGKKSHSQPAKAAEKQVTRSGTLLRSFDKSADVAGQKAYLVLKSDDGSVTSLGEADSIPKALGYERYIGKQVEVKFTPQRVSFFKTRASNITDIKEVVAAKP